jgi:PAS domain S-box-containing protein
MEELFERVLDQSPDVVLIKGPNSKIIWANRTFREAYGMTNEQLRDLIDSPTVEPDLTQQYVMDDLWVWENKRPLVIECEPVKYFDGTIHKYKTLKFPIFDGERIAYTAGISIDITESIESEQKLEASSKMAALGEIAGGIAHEINNPLAVISAKVRQLRRLIEQDKIPTKEKMLETLQTAESFTNRIAQIVEGLRSFSRDGTHDAFDPANLKKIVNETLTLCSARMESRGIKLDIDIPDEVTIKCRAVQISQVLLNLISNAIDAIDAIDQDVVKWIRISAEVQSPSVFVRVDDSGPGVPDEIANKIMQPFFTTKEVGKGTGLGLSISQGIVREHGGELRLDRSTSKSCFKVTLPLWQAQQT